MSMIYYAKHRHRPVTKAILRVLDSEPTRAKMALMACITGLFMGCMIFLSF